MKSLFLFGLSLALSANALADVETYTGNLKRDSSKVCTVQLTSKGNVLTKASIAGEYRFWNPTLIESVQNHLHRGYLVGGSVAMIVTLPFREEDFTDWVELVHSNATTGEFEEGKIDHREGKLSVSIVKQENQSDENGSTAHAKTRMGRRSAALFRDSEGNLKAASIYYQWRDKEIMCVNLKVQ